MPTIEWLRDLIICIYGIIGIVVLILFSILTFLFYKKAKTVMSALQTTTNNVNEIVGSIKEDFVNPAVQMMALFHGIRQIAGIVNSLFKKPKGE